MCSPPALVAGRTAELRPVFRRICESNKIHHVRHTVGSLLKDLKVPVRGAQTILGHTRVSTTLEIYTDTDEQARHDALTRLHGLLQPDEADPLLQAVATNGLSMILNQAVLAGGRNWVRTSDPSLVRRVLYH